MNNGIKWIIAGLAAAFCAGTAAWAQYGTSYPGYEYGDTFSDSSYYGNTASDPFSYEGALRDRKQTRLQGEIQSMQTRSINNRPMVIARIRTPDNRTETVLLGSSERLESLDLRQGDQVTIIGRQIRLNDRPALKAQRILADGQSSRTTFDLPRSQRQRFREQEPMPGRADDRPPPIQISGTIEEIQQVKIYGHREPHVVAAVSEQDGRIQVVDLGSHRRIERLGLEEGDRIQVRGVSGSINNNPVVIARQVRVDGMSMQIQRPPGRSDFRVKGEVADLRTASIGDRPHVIAAVETDEGRMVTVDLGPRSRLQEKDISLSRGQPIILIARLSRVDGRPILKATRISVNGRVMQRSI